MKKILLTNFLMTTFVILVSTVAIFTVATVTVFSQGTDSDFQRLLSNTQPILSKEVEKFNNDDINALNNVIALSPDSFGETNTRLLNNLISQARNKKREYEDFLATRKQIATTLDELDDETRLRQAAEIREEVLIGENATLRETIRRLQDNILKLEQQAQKMSQVNKKLERENLASHELLQTSSDLVAQMLMLMPKRNLDDTTMQELPTTLRDSLETAQCAISQILKSNFLITLQQLRANQPFMDYAATFFKLNKHHTAEIASYIENSNELVARMRSSGIDCAINYASDIENDMNSFLLLIENTEVGSNFADFILDNIIWIAPLCLLVLLGVVLIIRKTSNK